MAKPSLSEVFCIALVFSAMTAIVSPSQTLTTLHNFAGQPNDGKNPYAGLVQGRDGNFYGTTESGGATNHGMVFKMTPSGTVTILYSFPGYPSGGGDPTGTLIQASDGNFYGTTNGGNGGGIVFKITSNGALTTLHTFQPGQGDGGYPYAGLIQASDGNFYGTTNQGGIHFGNGTVFKITPNGTETVLYSFACSDSSGCRPIGGLVEGSDGNFYGTTSQGGSGSNDTGSVFKITPSGTLTTLHNFCYNCGEGYDSYATLVQATDGNFYGTTEGGGAHGDGTVFKITSSGTLTTLYSFCPGGSPCADGAAPRPGWCRPAMAVSTVRPTSAGPTVWVRSSKSQPKAR